jgi:hypothetical protein
MLASRNSKRIFLNNCLSKILCRLLYMHPLLGAHVVNGEKLQLVATICDEGSGLILGE